MDVDSIRAELDRRLARRETAEVVAETGLNVNRAGLVFVSAVERRDLAALTVKVAEASRGVYAELLEHRDAVTR